MLISFYPHTLILPYKEYFDIILQKVLCHPLLSSGDSFEQFSLLLADKQAFYIFSIPFFFHVQVLFSDDFKQSSAKVEHGQSKMQAIRVLKNLSFLFIILFLMDPWNLKMFMLCSVLVSFNYWHSLTSLAFWIWTDDSIAFFFLQ